MLDNLGKDFYIDPRLAWKPYNLKGRLNNVSSTSTLTFIFVL